MPFKADLRKRLQDLRAELDAGILPQTLYEEMCRDAIKECGDDPFDQFQKHFGETVAVLTQAQANLLNAIGDIDIDTIMPFIRRQRKRMLKENSVKQNVNCPECSKPFLNTQGLSTHLLAKHRKALDDYYMDSSTNTLKLKPPDYVNPLKGKNLSNGNKFDSSSAIANLASLASQRSAIETATEGGDGLWIVKQVNDSDNDSDSDSSNSSNEGSNTKSSDKNDDTTKAVNETSETVPELSNVDSGNDQTNENVVGENAVDKRKFNHGLQQRKHYKREIKLAAISMRDQGKCSEEIAKEMNIPKSNIEKWSSAQGREKIMRHLYNDMMSGANQNKIIQPQGFPINHFENNQLSNFNRASFNAPPHPNHQMNAYGQYFTQNSNTTSWPLVTYSSGSLSSNLPPVSFNNSLNMLDKNNVNENDDMMMSSMGNTSMILPPFAPTNKRMKTNNSSKAFPTLPVNPISITTKRTNTASSNSTATAPKTISKRLPTANQLAVKAAVVAAQQNISFNNEGFSDSDDDNDGIGLIGSEPIPLNPIQRITNTSV